MGAGALKLRSLRMTMLVGYVLLFVSMGGVVLALTVLSHGPWQEATTPTTGEPPSPPPKTAPALPPPSDGAAPPASDSTKKTEQETKLTLVGSARYLMSGLTSADLMYKSDSLRIATLERDMSRVTELGVFVGDFIFYKGEGPYEVRVFDDSQNMLGIKPNVWTTIIRNDQHFVRAQMNFLLSYNPYVTPGASKQIQIDFYKKEKK
jgi:hypothetical protein